MLSNLSGAAPGAPSAHWGAFGRATITVNFMGRSTVRPSQSRSISQLSRISWKSSDWATWSCSAACTGSASAWATRPQGPWIYWLRDWSFSTVCRMLLWSLPFAWRFSSPTADWQDLRTMGCDGPLPRTNWRSLMRRVTLRTLRFGADSGSDPSSDLKTEAFSEPQLTLSQATFVFKRRELY